jgi:hypothetical protein
MGSVKVEVRPIEAKRWHNKTGQESFTRPKKIQALVDATTMKYATGLTDAEVKELLTKKNVSYDLTSNYNSDTPHPFWDSNMAVVKLENNTMFFNVDNPLDFIKVRIMKASKFVANSMAEYDLGMWPEATHVIFDEAEQASVLASKVEQKNTAIIEASKLSLDRKVQLILVLGGKNMKNQSADFVAVELDKIIQKDAGEFLRFLNMDKKQTAAHALVLEALQKSVLRREGQRIFHMDSPLGIDEIEVAEYLSKEENQDIKLMILSKINN